jgi:hypothetical protein
LKEVGKGERGGEEECKNVCSAHTPANRSQQIEQHGRQHSSKQKQMSASKDRHTHTQTQAPCQAKQEGGRRLLEELIN